MEELEYWLGPDSYGGYEIIQHSSADECKEGDCLFNVNAFYMGEVEGPGFPYDNTYIKVAKDVLDYVKDISLKCEKDISNICDDGNHKINRPLQVNDCLCDNYGWFMRIKRIAPPECEFELFYSDGYGLNLDMDSSLDDFHEFTLEEIYAEYHIIPSETYNMALEILKKAFQETFRFLDEKYKSQYIPPKQPEENIKYVYEIFKSSQYYTYNFPVT